jgi:hypothetical protein
MRERRWARIPGSFGRTAVLLLLGAAVVCTPAAAQSSFRSARLDGKITGHVRNAAGVGQMGATVLLLNRYDKLVRQLLTDDQGLFSFAGLPPDFYNLRVTLPSFVPALKRGIQVQAGVDSVLNINLASVLSSIELVYQSPSQPLMTDEWKWALRSAPSARPVLRYRPTWQVGLPVSSSGPRPMFSETRGLLNVSAGDAAALGALGTQADLGTAFALATSIFGQNQVQVSGNLGYVPNSAMPAAGFRTTFSRRSGGVSSPEITATVRQVYFPERGAPAPGMEQGVPALRTLSLSIADKVDLTDRWRLEYGASLDSVIFSDRLNYFSPYAKLSYALDSLGIFEFGYSSGAPPAELFSQQSTPEGEQDLRRNLAALAILPRMSLRNGRAQVQRTQNFEAGYRKVVGKWSLNGALYREAVANAAVTMEAPADAFVGGVLPDLGSRASILNAGRFQRWGFMGSASRQLLENLEVGVAVGRGGALVADRRVLLTDSAGELQSALQNEHRLWASARISGTVPKLGTRYASSYAWTDYTALMPGHLFLTQRALPETGWNVSLRQPLPGIGGMPGRLELSAEMRNLLEQGYLPMRMSNGRQFLMIQSPKGVRGGLSFIF